ncbi:MAG: tripartite tricarboxylate transporter TctB family protein [Pseudomonadota bacterium]
MGLAAIAVTFWTLIEELRKVEREQTEPERWKDVVVLMALAVSYAVLLRMFGGFVATVIFLGVTLMILNRAQPAKNALLAILIPGGIYLLFDRVLNANMPLALFELPI